MSTTEVDSEWQLKTCRPLRFSRSVSFANWQLYCSVYGNWPFPIYAVSQWSETRLFSLRFLLQLHPARDIFDYHSKHALMHYSSTSVLAWRKQMQEKLKVYQLFSLCAIFYFIGIFPNDSCRFPAGQKTMEGLHVTHSSNILCMMNM